ncbi:MAG: glycosyltransferase [Bacteroidaceae bacterium]|nr:glycosyltransferase [Bacteroidaceae bacterium]
MKHPVVTIVTVTRNAMEALQRTVQSVKSQTFHNYEYVVVDGASTDGTVAWLQNGADVPIRWISEPDDGIYDAMNKGGRMSKGEWVIFMNAGDCFVANDVLERVFTPMPNADVIYGDVVKNGVVKKASSPRNAHRMYFCHQSCFVRRSCLLEYPFDIRHKMSADFKQMKQLGLAGKSFLQLDFPIANFDTTGVSNTHRSEGLYDNICVVHEIDCFPVQLRLIPRLLFAYFMCRLRGK